MHSARIRSHKVVVNFKSPLARIQQCMCAISGIILGESFGKTVEQCSAAPRQSRVHGDEWL